MAQHRSQTGHWTGQPPARRRRRPNLLFTDPAPEQAEIDRLARAIPPYPPVEAPPAQWHPQNLAAAAKHAAPEPRETTEAWHARAYRHIEQDPADRNSVGWGITIAVAAVTVLMLVLFARYNLGAVIVEMINPEPRR